VLLLGRSSDGSSGPRTVSGVTQHAPRRSWARGALAVVGRPVLWPTAARQWLRAMPRGWWRRPPFLPRPDRAYLRFRLETQYGTGGAPAARDLVTYLEWCRADERANRARARAARR
jgi:hypothetical protein